MSWYPSLYAPRTGGAYDSHHRTAEIAGCTRRRGGAPIFRYGSGSSDVLHALLEHRVTPFRLLVGHSKGALQISRVG